MNGREPWSQNYATPGRTSPARLVFSVVTGDGKRFLAEPHKPRHPLTSRFRTLLDSARPHRRRSLTPPSGTDNVFAQNDSLTFKADHMSPAWRLRNSRRTARGALRVLHKLIQESSTESKFHNSRRMTIVYMVIHTRPTVYPAWPSFLFRFTRHLSLRVRTAAPAAIHQRAQAVGKNQIVWRGRKQRPEFKSSA